MVQHRPSKATQLRVGSTDGHFEHARSTRHKISGTARRGIRWNLRKLAHKGKVLYDPSDIENWKAANRYQSTSEAEVM